MESLSNKVKEILDLIKAIRVESNIGNIPSLPKIRPPAPPSMTPKLGNKTKLPGVAPTTQKDPKKIAQQIKDGSMSTKTQKIMLKGEECLKVEANGQWSLEKGEKKINPKDPVLNDKLAPKPVPPEKLEEMKLKLNQFLDTQRKLRKEEVELPSDEEKATV